MITPTVPANNQGASPATANGLHNFIDKVSSSVDAIVDAAPRESGASSSTSNAVKSKIAHAAALAK